MMTKKLDTGMGGIMGYEARSQKMLSMFIFAQANGGHQPFAERQRSKLAACRCWVRLIEDACAAHMTSLAFTSTPKQSEVATDSLIGFSAAIRHLPK